MGLQAKPAYWGIVDPTQLPGYGMRFSASVVPGERDTRTVTITATNGNVGPAYTTQLNGFTLTQIFWTVDAQPQITAPGSFPIALGRYCDERHCERGVYCQHRRLQSELAVHFECAVELGCV